MTLKFGVMVPQGWRMDLADIPDPVKAYETMTCVAQEAEAFRQALERIGVIDVFFELFDATHFEIEYRYPLSLKYLAERLSPEVV